MGFFDELDEQVGDIPPDGAPAPLPSDYDAVVQKLRGGWVHTLTRAEQKQVSTHSAAEHFQQVELSFDGDRFVWASRMMERRGRTNTNVVSESVRTFDDAGLMDAFVQNPWVGQACIDAIGGTSAPSDF